VWVLELALVLAWVIHNTRMNFQNKYHYPLQKLCTVIDWVRKCRMGKIQPMLVYNFQVCHMVRLMAGKHQLHKRNLVDMLEMFQCSTQEYHKFVIEQVGKQYLCL
jgi:hypothetical protein